MGQYRIQRLNDQLRDEISDLILKGEVKDPRVSNFLSINRVEVTTDLGYAKVYVSSFLPDNQVEKGVNGLNAAAGFIQREIAKKLRIRQFPKLQFLVDSGMKEGFTMVQKLNQLEKESKENAAKQASEDTEDKE
ncbi:MAG: 30S ribosome-binding factor RbfA [Treponema sp.]|nr:30S ribosome-binding factor RbfA [Treponema sp.]